MSSRTSVRCLVLALALIPLVGCSFHSTARAWNGRVGADGAPVFYTSTTKVGFKFLVVIPFLGNLDIDGMVDDLTSEVQAAGGDHIRIVQGGSENYWYGFPPFTWILTPVISRVDADWRPTGEEFALHAHEWAEGLHHGEVDDEGRCVGCEEDAEAAAEAEQDDDEDDALHEDHEQHGDD